MKRVSTATRLSISLVVLTVSVLLAAQSLGLVPDPAAAALRGRKTLCESMAIQASVAAEQGDAAGIRDAAKAIVARNGDVLSIGLRRADGELVVTAGAHAVNWTIAGEVPGAAVDGRPARRRAAADQVFVPIFQGEDAWGQLEIRFRPLSRGGLWGFLSVPVVRLTLFVGGIGFATYLFYLRKTLRYLDPTSVIPERVRAMLDTLAEGVLVLDRRERIVMANEAFARLIGRPAASLQGLAAASMNWSEPGAKAALTTFPWSKTLRGGVAQKGVTLCLRGDAPAAGSPAAHAAAVPAARGGSADWDTPEDLSQPGGERLVTVNCSPIVADQTAVGRGRPRGVLLTFDDVTQVEATNAQLREALEMLGRSRDEIERQNEELQALATTDPMTGCRNRRSFHAQFQVQWAAALRHAHPLACIMVDVDFFKRINDVHGHGVGDAVLIHVAGILKSLAREADVVCRYGGEEFCILMPHTDVSAAARAAERFRATIEASPCGAIFVTASVGVSAVGLGADAPQAMLDQADKSLYAAKRRGRNRVVRWDEIRDTPEAEASEAAKAASSAAGREGAPATATALAPSPAPVPTPTASPALSAAPLSPASPVAASRARGPIAFSAVTALMSALAHRDRGTAAHCERVADLCVATLTRGGGPLLAALDSRGRFLIEVAALLHDVGKLGVPDSVLLKPGPLSDAEWEVMRAHDRMGEEIITAAFGTAELTEIVAAHHARYAGNDGHLLLPHGREIPLGARLLAIADAYDAMVSDRPYRGARGRAAAFEELRRCAGTQFDPDLVEPFIAAVATMPLGIETPPEQAVAPHRAASETSLRIRLEVEQLACAAEANDLATLAASARQLAAVAAGDHLPDIAQRLEEIERAASGSGAATPADPEALLRMTGELIELCRSPQGSNRDEVRASRR